MNRSHGRRAAVAVALLATLLLAGACGQAPVEAQAGDAARGQTLWAQSSCMACHGAHAEGAEGGPALLDTPLTLRDITGLVRRGTPNMPAYSAERLSDQDLQDMFAWFVDPSAVASATAACDVACPAPAASAAQNPWPQSPCAGCHGASAEGGIGPALAGGQLSLAGFQATVREGRGSMPAFSTAQLSDQALRALFDALRPGAGFSPAGGQGTALPTDNVHAWVRAGCAECHGANAEGGSVGGLAGEEVSFEKLQRAVREGEEGMPAYETSQVSEADLQVIYDWLMALP
jgi:mono/diheme cytochrome c family protein